MDKPAQPAEPWLGEDGFLSPFIPPPPPPDLGSVRPERRGAKSSQMERLPGWAPSQRAKE